MSHHKSSIIAIALLLPFVLMREAQAYLDPATGSMILQIILGFILAASMTIKMYWRKIKFYFSKNKVQPETGLEGSSEAQEVAIEESTTPKID